MTLVQCRDHRAFAALYDRYAPRLNAFFFRMLWSDTELAKDHVQDLFAKLIDKPELYNPEYLLEPWLFRIASNMCKNTYRKVAFEQALKSEVKNHSSDRFSWDVAALDSKTLTSQVHQLLEAMDEERRTIFLLRYQQELSIREIADMFSLSEGTVKSKLFYTREKIKKSLIH